MERNNRNNENVEDEVIYNAVKSLSIDYAQGFYKGGKPRRSCN